MASTAPPEALVFCLPPEKREEFKRLFAEASAAGWEYLSLYARPDAARAPELMGVRPGGPGNIEPYPPPAPPPAATPAPAAEAAPPPDEAEDDDSPDEGEVNLMAEALRVVETLGQATEAVLRESTAPTDPAQIVVRTTAQTYPRVLATADQLEAFTHHHNEWCRTRDRHTRTHDVENEHYRVIIGMGPVAVPLILARLRVQPDFYHEALVAITGQNPVLPANLGDHDSESFDWLAWGRQQGLIE